MKSTQAADPASALRKRAEQQVDARATATEAPSGSPDPLRYELEVHRVELEMQNQELCAAQGEVEDGLRRYAELFEFAPIAYVILDSALQIVEANVECVEVLEMSRAHLVGKRFDVFFEQEQRGRLAHFLGSVLTQPGRKQTLEIALPRTRS
jgi:PAS domain-containing protein